MRRRKERGEIERERERGARVGEISAKGTVLDLNVIIVVVAQSPAEAKLTDLSSGAHAEACPDLPGSTAVGSSSVHIRGLFNVRVGQYHSLYHSAYSYH